MKISIDSKKCQFLIGKVQQIHIVITVVRNFGCQFLIGKVQPDENIAVIEGNALIGSVNSL